MEASLTPEQKLFVSGAKVFGCDALQMIVMGLKLWNLMEMIEYMGEYQDATPAQLYEVCTKIASKRPDPPDPGKGDDYGE